MFCGALALTLEYIPDEGVAILAGHRTEVLYLLPGGYLELHQVLILEGVEFLFCFGAWIIKRKNYTHVAVRISRC